MDPTDYKREVDRLSNELNNLSTDVGHSEPEGRPSKLTLYRPYIFIVLGALAFLYLVKPKVVLKIIISPEGVPSIVLDVKKFLLCWLILAGVVSGIYYIYIRFRKSPGSD
jgi:hypothetical protein